MKYASLISLIFIVSIHWIDHIFSRNPFIFADMSKNKSAQDIVYYPELCGIFQNDGDFLALFTYRNKSFVVESNEMIDNWCVDDIQVDHVILTEKNGTKKKVVLEA